MIQHPYFTRLFSNALFASALALAASPAFAADFPLGTYAIDATKPTLTFDDKGQFRVMQGDTLQVSGTYTVKGDEIRVTDLQGPWACTKEGQQSATYHWKYEKSVLTLNKLTDPCEGRVGSLDRVKWSKHA